MVFIARQSDSQPYIEITDSTTHQAVGYLHFQSVDPNVPGPVFSSLLSAHDSDVSHMTHNSKVFGDMKDPGLTTHLSPTCTDEESSMRLSEAIDSCIEHLSLLHPNSTINSHQFQEHSL